MSRIITIIVFILVAEIFVISACFTADFGEFLERIAFSLVALGLTSWLLHGH